MKLKEILNSKARFLGTNTVVDGKAAIVFDTLQEQVEFNQKLKNYIAMEAKLRDAIELMPEVITALECIYKVSKTTNADGVDIKELTNKLREWME